MPLHFSSKSQKLEAGLQTVLVFLRAPPAVQHSAQVGQLHPSS